MVVRPRAREGVIMAVAVCRNLRGEPRIGEMEKKMKAVAGG